MTVYADRPPARRHLSLPDLNVRAVVVVAVGRAEVVDMKRWNRTASATSTSRRWWSSAPSQIQDVVHGESVPAVGVVPSPGSEVSMLTDSTTTPLRLRSRQLRDRNVELGCLFPDPVGRVQEHVVVRVPPGRVRPGCEPAQLCGDRHRVSVPLRPRLVSARDVLAALAALVIDADVRRDS